MAKAMARAKKKQYQVLRNVVLGTLVFIMLGMMVGGLAQAVLIFMLTGIVEGTPIVVPIWGMLTIYMSIIAFICLTYYIDRELEQQHLKRLQAPSKLPRRRYSL